MSSETSRHSHNPVISARGLSKRFSLYDRPSDRLKQLLWGSRRQYGRAFWALQDVDFDIHQGEVVGVVGRNGAGKSTLLQLVCGTLTPTSGSLTVRGRVAALLELGAGFNPDFSGLENVYMNAAILGLARAEVDDRLDAILAFADIGAFIHQPVKTYSSGMYVRLAFAVATSVEPDILVVDEALSVGDGAFARKSFDRIMALKEQGATILFCSHSMYHVQALCSRALWLEGGRIRMWGPAAKVTVAYETALVMDSPTTVPSNDSLASPGVEAAEAPERMAPAGTAVLTKAVFRADGVAGTELAIHSCETDLEIELHFVSDPALPCPSVAIGIAHANGTVVASAGTANDGLELTRNSRGAGKAILTMPRLALLKGDYSVSVILACERGLHVYEVVERAAMLRVVQTGLEQGLVSLAHRWHPVIAS